MACSSPLQLYATAHSQALPEPGLGVKLIFRSWGVDIFAYVILTMIPPVVIVIFLQRWFIQGLFQTK